MKAENENIEEGLQDDLLSKLMKDSKAEDGLSSNFTHQVMGKIEQLDTVKKHKPLIPVWAWIIIAGGFLTSIILAVVYGTMPEEPIFVIEDKVFEFQNEMGQYLALATGILAVIFLEMLIRYKRNSAA